MTQAPVTLNNDDLFITRKRKKWKFAHFDSYQNCFEFNRGADPAQVAQDIKSYLPKNHTIVLELAAGNAQFSLALARQYPEVNFIAIDIKSDRLYTSAKKALQDATVNIAFVRTHINELTQLVSPKSVDEIWLTFPDPFPRDRSAKHRLTHSRFLKQYQEVLKNEGTLKFKTDNRNLFLWSLEQFVGQAWHFNELSFDLHSSDLPADYKIKTHYEQRYNDLGVAINYCSIRA